MIYGLDKSNGLRITASPGSKAICPSCETNLIAKCGNINVWHFAHEKGSDCDVWNEGETEWHLNWKSNFPASCVEIPIEKDNQKHRADICFSNGVVIEFQHSFLSVKEILEREKFYQKMIWIFDITDTIDLEFWGSDEVNRPDTSNFDMRPRDGYFTDNNYCTFRWKHARKTIAYAQSPVYLDIGNNKLFQIKKMYPESPCGGFGYLRNKTEFIQKIKVINHAY